MLISMDISIVIPCLNEEQTIGICIKKCFNTFKKLGICGEVIVADNGSSDNSVIVAKNEGATVVHCSDKGYGNTLRTGFTYAKGEWVLMGDADDTYDFNEIELFYKNIDNNIDMIIGTRLNGNIEKGAMPFMHRYIGTPVITAIINLLYGTKISDSQCGMRMMRKSTLEHIELKTTGMEFASELIVQFAKKDFKIKEIPISLHKNLTERKPHLNPWKDGLRHLFYIIKSKLN